MNRQQYQDARRGYRCARRRDIEWKEPEVWAYRERTLVNQIPQRPDFAIRYLAQFTPAIRETFFKPVQNHRGDFRLRTGPRSNAMRNAREVGGLNLAKRVAVRSARRQIAALEAQRALPAVDLERFANGLLAGNQSEIAASLGVAA